MNLSFGLKNEVYKAIIGSEAFSHEAERFQAKHIDLIAVRNQTAAFQLLLKSDEDFLLSVSHSACFDKRGHMNTIRLDVVFDTEDGLSIGKSMKIIGFVEDDDRQYKADLLLDQESIHVRRGELQPVWIELGIPESIRPGEYMGRVEIFHHIGFTAEQKIGEATFRIAVRNVTLPEPKDYTFYLDLWQHNSNIARKHEVPLWSDEHFSVMEKYVASLAQLGQKAITIVASEIPWSGQFSYRDVTYLSNLFEYSMIRVEKQVDGKLAVDFSVMDRYIDLCFKYGIDREIEVFGIINIWMCEEEGFGRVIEDFSDGIRVRYLDRSDNCFKYINTVDDIAEYIGLIERHFKDRGLIDKVRIAADEPADVGLYRERLSFLKSIAPSFKYKTIINRVEFIMDFKDEIQDFVPMLPDVCSEFEHIMEIKGQSDKRVYWYVCCWPPIPNTFISSNLLESYVIGWLTEYMGLEGFVRWNYTVWPEKPRERISFKYPYWKAGDTNFVYPSNHGSPLLTLRYKALMRGIQAHELIGMLKKTNPRAKEIIDKAFGKIFKLKDIAEFHPDSQKKIDQLISLDYRDYVEALEIIISGIL